MVLAIFLTKNWHYNKYQRQSSALLIIQTCTNNASASDNDRCRYVQLYYIKLIYINAALICTDRISCVLVSKKLYNTLYGTISCPHSSVRFSPEYSIILNVTISIMLKLGYELMNQLIALHRSVHTVEIYTCMLLYCIYSNVAANNAGCRISEGGKLTYDILESLTFITL